MRLFLSVCFVAACCFLCHCGTRSSVSVSPEGDSARIRADRLLQEILTANTGIETVKSIGRVKLKQNDQSTTFRAGWVGEKPDRFRIDVRTITGQPVMSFATDGKRIYFLSYSDNRLYRHSASKNSLKRIISLEMSPKDLLALLSGSLPVHQNGNVRLEKDAGGGGMLLVIGGRGRDDEDRIYLDGSGTGTVGFERRDFRGKLLFRALFDDTLEIQGYRIPKSLSLSNDNGVAIDITIERSWINQEVDGDTFVLKSL